jgi:hypothetical protein
LRNWAEKQLPKRCIEVGTKTLMAEFVKLVTRDNTKKNHDDILNAMKMAITDKATESHNWDIKAMDSLVI